MKRIIFIVCLFAITKAYAQNTFQAVTKDSHTQEPLVGATAVIEGTRTGASADLNGLIRINNIPNGKTGYRFFHI